MSYNGWTNHATWSAKLWLDEAAEPIMEFVEDAAELFGLAMKTGKAYEAAAKLIGDQIQDYMYELIEYETLRPIQRQFMNIDEIDWRQLAESYIEDYLEAQAHED
jgi:hypothetical protein